jgi:hypothetical protein
MLVIRKLHDHVHCRLLESGRMVASQPTIVGLHLGEHKLHKDKDNVGIEQNMLKREKEGIV